MPEIILYGQQVDAIETATNTYGLDVDNKIQFPESNEVDLSAFFDFLDETNKVVYNLETSVKTYVGTVALTEQNQSIVQNACNQLRNVYINQKSVGSIVEKVTTIRIKKTV